MTRAEKDARYAYAKNRRQRLNREMRAAGIIGAARPQMSEAEKKAHRKVYSTAYRKKVFAEAKAYRQMMKSGG